VLSEEVLLLLEMVLEASVASAAAAAVVSAVAVAAVEVASAVASAVVAAVAVASVASAVASVAAAAAAAAAMSPLLPPLLPLPWSLSSTLGGGYLGLSRCAPLAPNVHSSAMPAAVGDSTDHPVGSVHPGRHSSIISIIHHVVIRCE